MGSGNKLQRQNKGLWSLGERKVMVTRWGVGGGNKKGRGKGKGAGGGSMLDPAGEAVCWILFPKDF